jgi:hypothetical protein
MPDDFFKKLPKFGKINLGIAKVKKDGNPQMTSRKPQFLA